jgi:hypothetical protein
LSDAALTPGAPEERGPRRDRGWTIAVAIVLLYPTGLLLALGIGASWQMFRGTGSFPWTILTPISVVVMLAVGFLARRWALLHRWSRSGAFLLGEIAALVIGGALILGCLVGSTG